MKILVFTDDDLDGIVSAHLVELGFPEAATTIWYQRWYQFGLTNDDIARIKTELEKGYTDFYLLDLGADQVALAELSIVQKTLAGEGKRVRFHVFDNHPAENYDEFAGTFQMPDFEVDSDNSTCTAGVVFEHYETRYQKDVVPWAETLAILGLVGDVAYKPRSTRGHALYTRLLKKHPELQGKRVNHPSKEENVTFKSIVYGFTVYFNWPRRMYFDEGVKLSAAALKEADQFKDLFVLHQLPGVLGSKRVANILKVQELVTVYSKEWSQVLRDENCVTFIYEDFVFCVISNPWLVNVGVAMIKASEFGRPAFVLNTGLPHPEWHLTGRTPGKLDLTEEADEMVEDEKKEYYSIGGVFRRATAASNGVINGGGLDAAGSARVPTGTPIGDIIRHIHDAIREVKREEGTG